MVAACHSGGAAAADDLPFADRIPGLYRELAHVSIEGLQAEAVIDDDTHTVDPEVVGKQDDTVIACLDFRLGDGRQVVAKVVGFVDLFAFVVIGPVIGEQRQGCSFRLTDEGAVPERSMGCLLAQLGHLGPVLFSDLAVDIKEHLQWSCGIRNQGLELGHFLVKKGLGDIDAAITEAFVVGAIVDPGLALIAGQVFSDHAGNEVLFFDIVGVGEKAGVVA